MKISNIALLFTLTFSTVAGSAFPAQELSRDEAIKLAEMVIAKNGCSDLTPIRDRPKLSTYTPKAKGEFIMRHDLECHALYAREGRVEGKPSWIIGFHLRHHPPESGDYERLLLMTKDGNNLRLENRKNRIARILKENR